MSFGLQGLLALTLLNRSTVSLRVSSSSLVRTVAFGGLGTFALAFLTLTVSDVNVTLSSTLSCEGFEEAFCLASRAVVLIRWRGIIFLSL